MLNEDRGGKDFVMGKIENLGPGRPTLPSSIIVGCPSCKAKDLEIQRLRTALKLASSMIEYVGCQEECSDGHVPDGNGWAPCRWCDEHGQIKQALAKGEGK